jgi:hypothetical protein
MKKKSKYIKEAKVTVNEFHPDTNADKSGTDCDADKTLPSKKAGKFDKPTKETNPDKTGISLPITKSKK